MLKHIDLPVNSVQSAHLQLTEEQEKNAKVLYRTTSEGYVFVGLYNPEIPDSEYVDGIVAIPIRSTFLKTETLTKGKSVWNVAGSTDDDIFVKHDPKGDIRIKNPAWKQIWRYITESDENAMNKCYVKGSVRNKAGNTDCSEDEPENYIGGHMQLTACPTTGKTPAGIEVYIVPICQKHNNCHNKNQMSICENVKAIVLNYLINN